MTPIDQCHFTSLQGECSYVSLRDIDRAMIVFKFFYAKLGGTFGRQVNEVVSSKTHKFVAKVLQIIMDILRHEI